MMMRDRDRDRCACAMNARRMNIIHPSAVSSGVGEARHAKAVRIARAPINIPRMNKLCSIIVRTHTHIYIYAELIKRAAHYMKLHIT